MGGFCAVSVCGELRLRYVLTASMAVPAASPAMHGFAPALTSFVGRDAAVDEVAGLLVSSRLVAVTGPGGVGKTRLAAEVARRVADRYADGVWLVELAAVEQPGLVPGAVATVLGVRELPGVPVTDSLARVLARHELLLVLDNCEHVIGAVAQLCTALLRAADDLRVLATSREPVRIAGEARYRLPPLALPAPDDGADPGRSAAVALFADRARQADPHFTLDGESVAMAARLVARLDGMPLAIELAAARADSLGLSQLLDRINDRLGLLVAGDRTAPVRQQSLTAAVDWSYRLLSEQEQQVFRMASVFPAAFTLEAAQAVAGPAAGPDTLHLVECSLLGPPRPGADSRTRYVMLETLRAYGAARLAETGQRHEADAALARYALHVAEQAAAGLRTGAGELAATRWLDAEDATVHQGLAWALEHDRAVALRLALALAPWWRVRGRYVAGAALLRAVAGHAVTGSKAWCAAHLWLGSLATTTSDFAEACSYFTAVRDALAGQSQTPRLVDALSGRSLALTHVARIMEGIEDARRAVTLAGDIGYPAGEALALGTLAAAFVYADDADSALVWAEQAARIDPAAIPGPVTRWCNQVLMTVQMRAGQTALARRNCEAVLAQSRQVGDPFGQLFCCATMAWLDVRAGRLPQACAYLREALELGVRISARIDLVRCLDCCGHLCAALQHWTEAITLWAAYAARVQADALSELPPFARLRCEPLQTARNALGPEQTRAAEQRGKAMTLVAAVEFAVMVTMTCAQRSPPVPERGYLTPRERELLTLIAQGRTDAQIAKQLFISVRTVRSHLDRIRDKTGCRRRADLTRLALQADSA